MTNTTNTAFAKLLAYDGQDFFIRTASVYIGRRPGDNVITIGRPGCSSVAMRHFKIAYSKEKSCFELVVLSSKPVVVDGNAIKKGREPVALSHKSTVIIPCYHCVDPHAFCFLTPTKPVIPTPTHRPAPAAPAIHKWNINEKEQLKRFLLAYGYGRWEKLPKGIQDKDPAEISAYANSFIRSTAKAISDEPELSQSIVSLLEDSPYDKSVAIASNEWGKMDQRASVWGRRIRLLSRLTVFIDKYGEEQLLDNISDAMLLGQTPAPWWKRRHDKDLIVGTHRHGYANYSAIRLDPSLSFYHECKPPSEEERKAKKKDDEEEAVDDDEMDTSVLMVDESDVRSRSDSMNLDDPHDGYSRRQTEAQAQTGTESFPSSDTLTRRLKKLVECMVKSAKSSSKKSSKSKESSSRKSSDGSRK
eukprot:GILJ01006776.1.p1 GENE.GILJ01006776.1~~GILJ01006776.1.p1  ORF type:complete len:416 (+),score=65.49 GILJ01006776.1:46-1293(+)